MDLNKTFWQTFYFGKKCLKTFLTGRINSSGRLENKKKVFISCFFFIFYSKHFGWQGHCHVYICFSIASAAIVQYMYLFDYLLFVCSIKKMSVSLSLWLSLFSRILILNFLILFFSLSVYCVHFSFFNLQYFCYNLQEDVFVFVFPPLANARQISIRSRKAFSQWERRERENEREREREREKIRKRKRKIVQK